MNISVVFEKVVHPQLYTWIAKFIPVTQFGFLKAVGSREYGCTLMFKMLSVLERRGEGILISLDVKGAFDRVWWAFLKVKLEARGMEGKALALIKDYLYKRFLQVVCQGDTSTLLEIFSGVPQGAVWSPSFWDFDIADMPEEISSEGDDFSFADDCGLWYEVTQDNYDIITTIINSDLERLVKWGEKNHTTFEPEKTTFTIISRKKNPFDPFARSSGIVMEGQQVKRVEEVKLVGYLFDSKLTMGSMVNALAKKARSRVAALRRLKPMLDRDNLQLMYTMFIRSIMEYGNLVYMGAAKSHLEKLDRIQDSAMKLGGFTVESLQSRREAAAIDFALNLLNGGGYGELKSYKPVTIEPLRLTKKRTRYAIEAGTQLKSNTKASSLESYKQSYLGSIHEIWAKLPQSLVSEGKEKSWQSIRVRAKRFMVGKWSPKLNTQNKMNKIKKVQHSSQVYSTKLNNELNAQTDWDQVWRDIRNSGISISDSTITNNKFTNSK